MEPVSLIIGLVIGLVVAGAVWFIMKTRLAGLDEQNRDRAAKVSHLEAEADGLKAEAAELKAELARADEALSQERRAARERLEQEQANAKALLDSQRAEAEKHLKRLEAAHGELKAAFGDLSARALKSSTEEFLKLARQSLEKYQTEAQGDLTRRQEAIDGLVKPIAEKLAAFDTKMTQVEQQRRQAYGGLLEQIKTLKDTGRRLEDQTGNLVTALRRPQVRGRWGEIQLKRVVEFAGMLRHCDFVEQESVTGEEGRLRPDLIVRLPGQKTIVVDSKAPLEAYLSAIEADSDEARGRFMAAHVRQIKDHMAKLGAKNYWSQFEAAPDFVVMFVPGEAILSAALEQDPDLMEAGFNRGVLLATPTTLIALLRSAAYGWRQERLAENAQHISQLGHELYERICTLTDHFSDVGRNLSRAAAAYNKAVGSLESRVLPGARKFLELGVKSPKTLAEDSQVETAVRSIDAPELTGSDEPGGDPKDT